MEKTKNEFLNFPSSYSKNSKEEEEILHLANNFERQFEFLHPQRPSPPLYLENEFKVSKIICTSLCPFKVNKPSELRDWQDCASFIANFIEYDILEFPTKCPTELFSLDAALKRRRGNSLDMSMILTTLLLSSDIDAYTVQGYATRDVTDKIERDKKDPQLPLKFSHFDELSSKNLQSVRAVKKNKYYLDFSKAKAFWMEGKQTEESEEPKIEYQIKEKKDALFGKRVHFWVLIQLIENDEKQLFFIESTTGEKIPLDDPNYLGIEFVWNNKNFWCNNQKLHNSCKELQFEIDDYNKWHAFLPEYSLLDSSEQRNSKIRMPDTWLTGIQITQKDVENKYPLNGKHIQYKTAEVFTYNPQAMEDGVVYRVIYYQTDELKIPIKSHSFFNGRVDNLEYRFIDFTKQIAKECFLIGREDALKEHKYQLGNDPRFLQTMKYFSNLRQDRLAERSWNQSKTTDSYLNRSDFLFEREVIYEAGTAVDVEQVSSQQNKNRGTEKTTFQNVDTLTNSKKQVQDKKEKAISSGAKESKEFTEKTEGFKSFTITPSSFDNCEPILEEIDFENWKFQDFFESIDPAERYATSDSDSEKEVIKTVDNDRSSNAKDKNDYEDNLINKQNIKKENISDKQNIKDEKVSEKEATYTQNSNDEKVLEENATDKQNIKEKRVSEEKVKNKQKVNDENVSEENGTDKQMIKNEKISKEYVIDEQNLENKKVSEEKSTNKQNIRGEKDLQENVIDKENINDENVLKEGITSEQNIKNLKVSEKKSMDNEKIKDEKDLEENLKGNVNIKEEKVSEEKSADKQKTKDEKDLQENVRDKEKIEDENVLEEDVTSKQNIKNEKISKEKSIDNEKIKDEKNLEETVKDNESIKEGKVSNENATNTQNIKEEKVSEENATNIQNIKDEKDSVKNETNTQNIEDEKVSEENAKAEQSNKDKKVSEESEMNKQKIKDEKISEENATDQQNIRDEKGSEKTSTNTQTVKNEKVSGEKETDTQNITNEKVSAENATGTQNIKDEKVSKNNAKAEQRNKDEKVSKENATNTQNITNEKVSAENATGTQNIKDEKVSKDNAKAEQRNKDEKVSKENATNTEKIKNEKVSAENATGTQNIKDEKVSKDNAKAEQRNKDEKVSKESATDTQNITNEKVSAENATGTQNLKDEKVSEKNSTNSQKIKNGQVSKENVTNKQNISNENISEENATTQNIRDEKVSEQNATNTQNIEENKSSTEVYKSEVSDNSDEIHSGNGKETEFDKELEIYDELDFDALSDEELETDYQIYLSKLWSDYTSSRDPKLFYTLFYMQKTYQDRKDMGNKETLHLKKKVIRKRRLNTRYLQRKEMGKPAVRVYKRKSEEKDVEGEYTNALMSHLNLKEKVSIENVLDVNEFYIIENLEEKYIADASEEIIKNEGMDLLNKRLKDSSSKLLGDKRILSIKHSYLRNPSCPLENSIGSVWFLFESNTYRIDFHHTEEKCTSRTVIFTKPECESTEFMFSDYLCRQIIPSYEMKKISRPRLYVNLVDLVKKEALVLRENTIIEHDMKQLLAKRKEETEKIDSAFKTGE